MSKEKHQLTWDTYSDAMLEMMTGLVEKETFSDVTLICEDSKQIKAHKTMLSVCSPVLKDIFHADSSLHCTIILNGVYFSEMESVLKFLHFGEEAFNLDNLDNILAVANNLGFKELSDKIEDHINSEFDSLTARKIYKQEQNDSKYACNECTYQTPIQDRLKKHVSFHHHGIRYKCNECEKEFSTQGALSRHHKSAHKIVRYSCDICDNQFTQPFTLKVHIQSVHEGLRYECKQCSFQSTQKGQLKRHIQLQHKIHLARDRHMMIVRH